MNVLQICLLSTYKMKPVTDYKLVVYKLQKLVTESNLFTTLN